MQHTPPLRNQNVPATKKEIFGWAMFDVANSSYTTAIITFTFSAFFISHIVPEDSTYKDSYWSIAIGISTLFTIFLSPLLGRLIDINGGKKLWLMASTLVCSFASLSLWMAKPGDVWLAICFLAVSNTAFMLSETFCSSFLTDISTKKNIAFISGLGWGLGYLGGFLSMILITFALITTTPAENAALFIEQNRLVPVVVGFFFLIAALPTFIFLKDRSQPNGETFQLSDMFTCLNILSVRDKAPLLFSFFIAFIFFMAGMNVVIKFIGIYTSEELNIEMAFRTNVFIAIQFSALGGALLFGYLERFYGSKNIILASIGTWLISILGLYFIWDISEMIGWDVKYTFLVIALLAGSGIGSLQSSSRTVVGLLSPKAHITEMYGFWSLFSRLSILLALTFGFISDIAGRHNSLLLIIVFFVIGAILLMRVPLERKMD
jgi:MFS transporter, UMF1 family